MLPLLEPFHATACNPAAVCNNQPVAAAPRTRFTTASEIAPAAAVLKPPPVSTRQGTRRGVEKQLPNAILPIPQKASKQVSAGPGTAASGSVKRSTVSLSDELHYKQSAAQHAVLTLMLSSNIPGLVTIKDTADGIGL